MNAVAQAMIPVSLDMSDVEFDRLSRLIRERSGINLGEHKRTLLRVRLSRRLRALGLRSFKEYYSFITEHDPDGTELVLMIDAISTNVTEFFREPDHFEYLSRQFFPRWGKEPVLRILSAGCSSGEEPYSIAMCALEALGAEAGFKAQITACDISTQALARARTAIYPMEKMKSLSNERLRAFFLKGTGRSEGLVLVAPAVQSMVKFLRVNIVQPLEFDKPFHAIFCRNVAIYFDRPTQKTLFASLYRSLVPRGLLFVGHSESMSCWNHAFNYLQPTVYERPGEPAR